MKLQNKIRISVISVGLAMAMLLLVGSVSAQEIENTVWNDSPTVVPFEQPLPTSSAADLNSIPDSSAISLASLTPAPATTQEATLTQWPPIERWMLASLLVCIGLAALYAVAEDRRANRYPQARAIQVKGSPALL